MSSSSSNSSRSHSCSSEEEEGAEEMEEDRLDVYSSGETAEEDLLDPDCGVDEEEDKEDDDEEDEDEVEVEGEGEGEGEDEEEGEEEEEERRKKKKKPGIIYLSSIPPGFNVSRTTAYFSKFGQVGRVFLQPNSRDKSKYKSFTEGWIEFMSKRLAREVAESLNCSHVGGKKRSKASETLWNVKYLPRFKWSHLTERTNYEKAVHSQRMRSEVSQAKKEVDYFKANLDKSKRMKKSHQSEEESSRRPYDFFLKETETALLSKRKRQCSSAASSPSKRVKRDVGGSSPPAVVVSKRGKKNKGKGKSTMKRSEFLKNVFGGSAE